MTCGVCEATSTATSRASTSRSSHAATSWRTVSVAPPITVDCGEATTAITTSLTARRVSSSRTCAVGSSTAAIAPAPARRRHSRDRRQITRSPSCSDNAPATTAAETSPREWPITAPGRTPRALIASASATCMTNRVGCTRSMPVTVSAAVRASVTEKPDSAAINGSAAATVAAKAGSVASRSAPIAAHCEPCPENTHTGPRSSRPTACSSGPSPAANPRSARTNSWLSPAISVRRTGRRPRRDASV